MGEPYDRPKSKTDHYPNRLPVRSYTCAPNYLWLATKYGLTDDEIDENFFYAPLSDRHVYCHKDSEGDEFFEARSVSSRAVPKSQQYGNKPTVFMGKYEEQKTLVIVEDIISAIKVGRQYGAMPLFGAFLSARQMAEIGRLKLDRVIVWLDCDKYTLGMKYAKDLGILVPSVAIQTYEDPKFFNDEVIAHIVENAIDALETA